MSDIRLTPTPVAPSTPQTGAPPVEGGVRGFWVTQVGPVVMLSGLDAIADVDDYEQAVLEVYNAVLDRAENSPDQIRQADAEGR